MHAFLDTPFEHLHWTSQDIADAVPPRPRDFARLYAFDAIFDGQATPSANAARFQRSARPRRGYLGTAALPARFDIR